MSHERCEIKNALITGETEENNVRSRKAQKKINKTKVNERTKKTKAGGKKERTKKID